MTQSSPTIAAWPELPLAEWRETQETLHRWLQIVGKVALARTPFLNQWWHVGYSLTTRGLTTGLIPDGERAFGIDFDFIGHALTITTTTGEQRALPLIPRSVAAFYEEFFTTLASLDIRVTIDPMPVEIVNPIPCDVDHERDAYDAAAVERWWRIMLSTELVLQRYRTPFVGKASPPLFFWGSFDLTMTRFNGRPASLPPGAPVFMQLAEDQENVACGFWPGNANYAGLELGEPAFYAYIFPEPASFPAASVRPAAASYRRHFGQFILPYAAVRALPDPAAGVLDFFTSAYEAAAESAGWDRAALERHDLPVVPRA